MPTTRIVPDHVWAQLDPKAGRLSHRERRFAILLVLVLVIVLVLAVAGYLSGAVYPRIDGDMVAARGTPRSHELDVRVRLDNPGWVDQDVSAVTVTSDSITVIATSPSSLVLSPGAHRTVRMRIDVTDCASLTQSSLLPVSVVVRHWWGHESHVLFTDHSNSGYIGVARLACHGG